MKTKYNDQICIKEVLIAKYSTKLLLPVSIIYNKFKNDPEQILDIYDFSDYEITILKLDEWFPNCYGFINSYTTNVFNSRQLFKLSESGKELIKLIKTRKETRYLLNKNCDLFPETANLLIL